MTIFVSLAAYRDPELVPTIRDALAKARRPDELRFGICFQHGPEDELPFRDDPRFRIVDVDWRESRGACWARAEVMKLYRGEDYFLQLDSHHRFVEGWDEAMLAQLAACPSEKPVLTAYLPSYTPDDRSLDGNEPLQMDFDRFTDEGIVVFRPSVIADPASHGLPVRARFVSGHFLLARGAFVDEVPYDPDLYFIGEEFTLSIRAFTHGWDLFHPGIVLVRHEYTRAYRPHKHWSDHVGDAVTMAWFERDRRSKARIREFLAAPEVSRFGLGRVRTLAEYEAYAGLDVARRKAHPDTRKRLPPPVRITDPGWASALVRYDLTLALDRASLPPDFAKAESAFVGFHDANGAELVRADATSAELAAALAVPGPTITLRRSFESDREPRSWTVWPRVGGEWIERIVGEIVVRRSTPTFVTALLDLSRHALEPPFCRSFEEHYLPRFAELLALDAPMVIYTDPALVPFVEARRPKATTTIVPFTTKDLEALPFFGIVDRLRQEPDFLDGAPWIPTSPQAALPHYAPLVLAKPLLLAHAARAHRGESESFFWIDAGLTHTVPREKLLDPALPSRLEAEESLVFAAFPYDPVHEVHGFPHAELARLAGVDRITHVVRGGLFGGPRHEVIAFARTYETTLRETLTQGLLGTEESVLTLIAHRADAPFAPRTIAEDGRLERFVDALLRPARAQAPRIALGTMDAALYVLGYQHPAQLARLLTSMERADPELLRGTRRVLFDNSTDAGVFPAFDALAARYGFEVVRQGNLGITGGRIACAHHFEQHGRESAMLYFEDDMLLEDVPGLCRNGFRTHVPRLTTRALRILRREPDLDFLKLSYTEVFGDHTIHWAYVNLDDAGKRRWFPHGPASRVDAITSHDGLAYARAEVHYSNWPIAITRRGSATLFDRGASLPRHEPGLMIRALELARAGRLRSAVLLASPIRHERSHAYPREARKEG